MHQWNVSPKEAIELQKKLQSEVRIEPLKKGIKYIAGADISLNRFSPEIFAGIIVFTFPEFEVVEHALVESKTDFPYIPGLLSFREVPALLQVWEKLNIKPNILMVDGQGIAHPRKIGIASHIGVLLDIPTIGVAKSPLYGIFKKPGDNAGSLSYIYDSPKGEASRYNREEVIGAALRSKERSKPLIISPGHKIDIEGSLDIVRQSLRGYRLPEPTRLAHQLVNQFRRGEILA
jgi:deoxyribonuclease V